MHNKCPGWAEILNFHYSTSIELIFWNNCWHYEERNVTQELQLHTYMTKRMSKQKNCDSKMYASSPLLQLSPHHYQE